MVMPHVQPQAGLDESAMALATLNRLSYLRSQAEHRELTEEEQGELAEHFPSCIHCGGHHARACPRVKRIVFRQGGAGVQEVEYFPAAEIDWTGVIFEDVGGGEEVDEIPFDDLAEIVSLAKINQKKWAFSQDEVALMRRVDAWLDSAKLQAVQSGHGQAAG